MAQCSPPPRRALIVEDEYLIALDLKEAMFALGFDICGLAPNDRKARSLAMSDHPDVALVDVYLDGAREGIETGRWLREVCGASIVFITAYGDECTIERIHEQVPGAPLLPMSDYRDRLANAVAEAAGHLT